MRAGSFLEVDTGLFPLVAFTLFYACSRLYKRKKVKWQTTDASPPRKIAKHRKRRFPSVVLYSHCHWVANFFSCSPCSSLGVSQPTSGFSRSWRRISHPMVLLLAAQTVMCTHWPPLDCQFLVESIVRNKAVADGAVSFCIDHHVTARVSKFAYGIGVNILYNPYNPTHISRNSKKFVDLVGEERIGDIFSTILPKASPLFPLGVSVTLTSSVLSGLHCQWNWRV